MLKFAMHICDHVAKKRLPTSFQSPPVQHELLFTISPQTLSQPLYKSRNFATSMSRAIKTFGLMNHNLLKNNNNNYTLRAFALPATGTHRAK